MIAHREEIYSRPKRTWFATEKEKKLVAKEAKVTSFLDSVLAVFLLGSQNQNVEGSLAISTL